MNLWKTDIPPTFKAVYNELQNCSPGDLVEKTKEIISLATQWLFNQLPPGGNTLLAVSTNQFFTTEKAENLTNNFTSSVLYTPEILESAYMLTTRLHDVLKVRFGQCVRRHHYVEMHAFNGPQPIIQLDPEVQQLFKDSPGFSVRFLQQIYLCKEHQYAACKQCAKSFNLLQQAPRFWTSSMPACEACLKHLLMFVERNHSARAQIISTKTGRRTVFKSKFVGVTQPSVPPGIAPDAIAGIIGPPPPLPTHAPVTYTLSGGISPNWMHIDPLDVDTTPPPLYDSEEEN